MKGSTGPLLPAILKLGSLVVISAKWPAVTILNQSLKIGHLEANNPLDLVWLNFTKIDPSRSGKENILVITDACIYKV